MRGTSKLLSNAKTAHQKRNIKPEQRIQMFNWLEFKVRQTSASIVLRLNGSGSTIQSKRFWVLAPEVLEWQHPDLVGSSSALLGGSLSAWKEAKLFNYSHCMMNKENSFPMSSCYWHQQLKSGTFSEVALETARHVAQVPHPSGSSGLAPDGLHTPVIWNTKPLS